MAFWLPNNGTIYLPPTAPVARVYATDEFVTPTNLFFHAETDRLLTIGHPYFQIVAPGNNNKIQIPKVSASQYRVMRMILPNPNKFALIDNNVYNPERERLVWRLRAVDIGRGGPLGIGTTGNPLFNKLTDAENPIAYPAAQGEDNRLNLSMEHKQSQMFILGCIPATGQHWDIAKPCANDLKEKGDCPPIQLVNSPIEDGDMADTGFGAVNFKHFQQDKAGVPLDIVDETCKYPDFLKMGKDVYGNGMFFFGRREQLFSRHYFTRAGVMGDSIPDDPLLYLHPKSGSAQSTLASHIYFPTPSGSLNSSETQLFNRPYYLQRAQGANNGICWNDQLFLTILDNTRGTNYTLSVYSGDSELNVNYEYKAADFKQYLRHSEEYEVEFVFQLCKVALEPDVLAHIQVMDPTILQNWSLAFVPPPAQGIEDTYRFLDSLATRCPPAEPPEEPADPYKDYTFWRIDLTDKFSSELSQYSLGRRFLFQMGMLRTSTKRVRSIAATTNTKRAKRKRKT
ncbi:L1 [Gammapapillomavirus sp.]|uniref:L1 n=1 Tax=Gammapapillomavirus sp. TaxID=2049444 RepID=UPI000C57E894|nr:L1 [Gammapapillomavirus sp.]ATQ38181.1 L1 [Gammapapillomavirus sp.]